MDPLTGVALAVTVFAVAAYVLYRVVRAGVRDGIEAARRRSSAGGHVGDDGGLGA